MDAEWYPDGADESDCDTVHNLSFFLLMQKLNGKLLLLEILTELKIFFQL